MTITTIIRNMSLNSRPLNQPRQIFNSFNGTIFYRIDFINFKIWTKKIGTEQYKCSKPTWKQEQSLKKLEVLLLYLK